MKPSSQLFISLGLFASIGLATNAQAQLMYSCRVGHEAYSAGTPPPECANVEIKVLNPDGSLNSRIPAPLTPAQRKKKQLEEEAAHAKDLENIEQGHQDNALLDTYKTEADIDAACQRDLGPINDDLARANAQLQKIEAERNKNQQDTKAYGSGPIPINLRQAIELTENSWTRQTKLVAGLHEKQQRVINLYADRKKRFHDLNSKTQ